MNHSPTTDVTFSSNSAHSLSEAVVDAVAKTEDVEPTDLSPLYTVIDSDALDSIFPPSTGGAADSPEGELTFSYQGYEVRVTAAGEVALTSLSDRE